MCVHARTGKHTSHKPTTVTTVKRPVQRQYIHKVVQAAPLSSSRTFLSSQKEALCPLAVTPPCPLPAPDHNDCTSCSGHFTDMESHNRCPPVTGLFH